MTKHDKNRPADILMVIQDFTDEYGYAPSMREIAARVGLASTSAVHHHIQKLRESGVLNYDPRISRSAVVHRPPPEPITVERLELAWCESVHGTRPPKVRPCKRHRVIAEWLVEVVIPKATAA